MAIIREDYEQHIRNYSNAYAKHFAALEKNPETIELLDEMAGVAGKILSEDDDEIRKTLSEELNQLTDTLLIKINEN